MKVSLSDDYWLELAKQYKVRLPRHATQLTTGKMQRWLRILGITNKEWRTWTGGWSLKQFKDNNPLINLRWFVGLMLEYVDEPRWRDGYIRSTATETTT